MFDSDMPAQIRPRRDDAHRKRGVPHRHSHKRRGRPVLRVPPGAGVVVPTQREPGSLTNQLFVRLQALLSAENIQVRCPHPAPRGPLGTPW